MLVPAGLADYSIVFAAGRMVLAYSANDPRAAALQVSGAFAPPASVPRVVGAWHEVLTAPGVRIAGAHPFLDPGGYRSHMIFELAQSSLKVPGLYNALLQHYQVTPADPAPGAAAPCSAETSRFNSPTSTPPRRRRNGTRRTAMRRCRSRSICRARTRRTTPASRVSIPGLGTAGSPPWVTIPASRVAWGVTIASNSRHRDAALLVSRQPARPFRARRARRQRTAAARAGPRGPRLGAPASRGAPRPRHRVLKAARARGARLQPRRKRGGAAHLRQGYGGSAIASAKAESPARQMRYRSGMNAMALLAFIGITSWLAPSS